MDETIKDHFARCFFAGAAGALGAMFAAALVVGIYKAVHAALGFVL